MKHPSIRLALLLPLLAIPAYAQLGNAEVGGVITDQSGAVLPGVTITALFANTGAKRISVSDSSGHYQFNELEVGVYRFQAELKGFTTVIVENYRLLVNQSAALDLQMKPAAVGQEVRVIAEAPSIQTNKSELAGTVSAEQVQALPVLGRSWLGFAVLAPGVKSDGSEGSQDAPPKAGIGVGRQDKVFLDGADLNNRSTAINVDIRISKEVIAEFQVKTTQFDAEYGQSGTSMTMAISRSGTDQFHGNGYFFFRDKSLNAPDFFTGKVLPFRNEQYGASLGGPIWKQKTQFFFNLERQHQPQTATSNTGFADLDQPVNATETRDLFFARVDQTLTDNHHLSFRFNRYTRVQPNASVGGAISPSDALSYDWVAKRYNLALNSVFGHSWVNELILSYLNNLRNLTPNNGVRYQFPSVSIGTINGGGIEHPTYSAFRNDTSVFFNKGGKHNFKFGEYFESSRVTGFFNIGTTGIFTFTQNPANLATCCAGANESTWDKSQFPIPTGYTQTLGSPAINAPNKVLGLYVQDDWSPAPRLTLNLGLRYDVEFGSLANNLKDAIYQQPFANYTKAFQPRIGFALALDNAKKTVLRGGAGIYYSEAFLNATFIVEQTNDKIQVTASTTNPTMDPNYINNPLGGRTFADYIRLLGTPAAPVNVTIFGPHARQPSEYNTAIGVAHQFAPSFSVQADFVYQTTNDQLRSIDSNLFCCQPNGDPWPVLSGNYPELGGFVTGLGRPNPAFGAIKNLVNTGKARYKGLQVAADKRFSRKYLFGMTYLLSRNQDNFSDIFDQASNPFNQKQDFGNSLSDQRHRFTANGVWLWPHGFTFSGIYYAASGSALATTTGGLDILGIQPDPRQIEQRPTCGRDPQFNAACAKLGIPAGRLVPRNAFRSAPVYRMDLGFGRPTHIGKREWTLQPTVDIFNVLNHKNFDPTAYQTVLQSPSFGNPGPSTSLVYQPRQVQVGIKFAF